MDEDDLRNSLGTKSPIKRLGSTRKLMIFNNIRLQLAEQLRCLDTRMETQVAIVAELQDFFRRRAEVELDYSRSLDKLVKSLQLRHKEHKQKREQWSLFSSYSCWQHLVEQTRTLSKDHAALSEIYSAHLVSKLSQVMEDIQRIYKKCREIGCDIHDEIFRVLHELHTALKTYQSYQGNYKQAETKLRLAEAQRHKVESSIPREKLDRSKKFRMIEKDVQKRKNKYFDAKLKALKARNEYILCIEASNATLHKYYVDDLSDLIDCMDLGFHHCISRALLMHVTSEEGRQKSIQSNIDTLNSALSGLDSRLDKQRFLEFNHTSFMIPKKLEFQGKKEDAEPEFQKLLYADMGIRLSQMETRINTVRAQNDEIWKTLETAEGSLLQILTLKDYDFSHFFGDNALPSPKPPETASLKLRADRHEIEEFYLTKLRDFLLGTSQIARLEVKYDYMRNSLAELSSSKSFQYTSNSGIKPSRRKCIGRLNITTQPKLFGGSLGEYIDSTNQDIPLIIRSCIRIINLYGLHHQGIFRVSGSQVEINNFRDAFEKGEDPLADITDASDMNSVAGVLKLYLRELREPLFPIIYFEQFMDLAQLESKHDFVIKMKDLIQSLPRSVIIVMRYLFAFLNHLSEFSDENMMDPYNLAICFGPTLVPVPEEKDQVQYQNQVNELIKNIIIFHEELFPTDIGGTMYEKYISRDEDNDIGDSPSENLHEDLDSEVYPSEDEGEFVEATAQYDFAARNERELSLTKGDSVTLYSQVSCDWWRGAVSGKEGLVPDKYISIKIREDGVEKSNKWEHDGDSEEKKYDCQFSESSLTDNIRNKEVSATVNSSWLPHQQIGNNSHDFIPQDSISDQIDEHSKEEIEIVLKSDVDISDTCDLGGSKSGGELLGSNLNVCEVVQQNIVTEGNEIRENKLIHTPDLVMDLPTQPDDNAVILESPDMTAAERFAKQNQCTLKKNTKQPKQVTDSKCNIPPKPPLKIKPEISLKPVCLMHVSKDVKQ
ncbi:SLIT-ROBO Rho GTPase-activating protein 1 isoform X1 [Halyomorpha halys]|uniref:SLIT-ROBO Rho GTPase-activating protein 1 isoform X1 n=1 Tax=Halyomorpha halys TaxID=286706 RepID=UPI0006D51194|nr:SLIT-ROBO Rho GTPase-activating protein 1 isoform X1 [Halyomorpha halys]